MQFELVSIYMIIGCVASRNTYQSLSYHWGSGWKIPVVSQPQLPDTHSSIKNSRPSPLFFPSVRCTDCFMRVSKVCVEALPSYLSHPSLKMKPEFPLLSEKTSVSCKPQASSAGGGLGWWPVWPHLIPKSFPVLPFTLTLDSGEKKSRNYWWVQVCESRQCPVCGQINNVRDLLIKEAITLS